MTLPTSVKKNLKKIYLLHWSLTGKMVLAAVSPMISPKFWQKVVYVEQLSDVLATLQMPASEALWCVHTSATSASPPRPLLCAIGHRKSFFISLHCLLPFCLGTLPLYLSVRTCSPMSLWLPSCRYSFTGTTLETVYSSSFGRPYTCVCYFLFSFYRVLQRVHTNLPLFLYPVCMPVYVLWDSTPFSLSAALSPLCRATRESLWCLGFGISFFCHVRPSFYFPQNGYTKHHFPLSQCVHVRPCMLEPVCMDIYTFTCL